MHKKKIIQMDTIIVQTKGLISADMDNEKVMMSIEQGKYYGLDAVGSYIWELLVQPVSVKQIIARLLEEYEVEANTCQKDVLAFLNKMHAKGVIAIG